MAFKHIQNKEMTKIIYNLYRGETFKKKRFLRKFETSYTLVE